MKKIFLSAMMLVTLQSYAMEIHSYYTSTVEMNKTNFSNNGQFRRQLRIERGFTARRAYEEAERFCDRRNGRSEFYIGADVIYKHCDKSEEREDLFICTALTIVDCSGSGINEEQITIKNRLIVE